MKKIINVGIFAHVDAGKTTLTEQILFNCGVIKNAGSVDKGTSLTDKLSVEKERGISVQASVISFDYKDVQINLIDTPGHVDFTAEVERSLNVIDSAVLIVSAVEGIQSQTEILLNALNENKIPTIIFINKIDRIGSDVKQVADNLCKEFGNRFIPLNTTVNEADTNANVKNIFTNDNSELIETIIENDDELFEEYLEKGNVDFEILKSVFQKLVKNSELIPILSGVAKNNIAVDELLKLIINFFPDSSDIESSENAAVVFKIEHDQKLGKVAGVRIYSGSLKVRDTILNIRTGKEEKVSQIKKYFSHKLEDIGELQSGDIGFICGMPEVKVGDVLGNPTLVKNKYSIVEPLLTIQVKPVLENDYSKLAEALILLDAEDPHLNFKWFKDDRELQINILGKIQIEILTDLLQTRFGIEVEFSKPNVIYKETISQPAIGFESYTMPKPCWAVVNFYIAPGKPGSGINYKSEVSVNDIERKYQNEIKMILPEAVKQGIKGWEVTDLEITLTEGEHHVIHSRPGDFKLATLMAIMNGLKSAGTTLLEPIIKFKIIASEEFLGKVTGDIINMRGSFEPAIISNGNFILDGKYPLATSLEYYIRLSSLTGGKAKLKNTFAGYEKCSDELGVVREYKGINPLDRSKFILKWRGAII